jgi:hypothetical protein
MTGNTDFEGGIIVFGGELNEWKSSLPYLLNVQRTKSVALASLECWSCAKMQAFISFVKKKKKKKKVGPSTLL